MSSHNIIGVVEKLLRYANHLDALCELDDGIEHVDEEVRSIVPLIDAALSHLAVGDPVRADLEEMRGAAVRALVQMRMLKSGAANAHAA